MDSWLEEYIKSNNDGYGILHKLTHSEIDLSNYKQLTMEEFNNFIKSINENTRTED